MNREASGTHVPIGPAKGLRRLWALALGGGAMLLLGAVLEPPRLWPNLLLLGLLLAGFGLGGMLLMAFRDLTAARWNDSFRSVREAFAATLPWTAPVLGLVLIAGFSSYPWSRPGALAEETDWFKRGWLRPEFVAIRTIAYLAIWTGFALAMVGAARREVIGAGPARSGVRLSAAFLVVFGLTFWLATTDWVMSLEPGWYSTAFGLYHFGGVLLSAQAAVILAAVWLGRGGPGGPAVGREQWRDLGTLLLSFSCFWMYVWFCQYMLIWYTNMPEETSHYASRTAGLWAPLFLANVAINWAVPFAVLLPRAAKENAGLLAKVALVVLVGRWLDVYLTVLPSTTGGGPAVGFCEIGAAALAAGGLGLLFLSVLRWPRSMRAPQSPGVATPGL